MALDTFKCNCLTPLHFKGLRRNIILTIQNSDKRRQPRISLLT